MDAITYAHARSYNALNPISEATRILADLGEEETVGKLLSVIQRYRLQGELGIRLLHKHNDILDDEIMYESALFDTDGFALETKAIPKSECQALVANSWQLTGHVFMPVEFSDPALLVCPSFDIARHPDVLRELAQVLHETGAEYLLGPCLLYGTFVESHAPYQDSAFLEKTDTENRANVVRYVEMKDISFRNSAKTKWRAVQAIDDAGNLFWTTACNCFCSVFPSGGHQGTTSHRYTP
ncbi:hypothetical protein GYM54_20615 [Pseudomonas sp. MTM4]|mgnify:CR=1 FL=1|uniref:hypothetical protein n=1 Tax=unclassified Pseudomonas TaxID=196821 RepID=UPI0018D20453|nr:MULTISPECIES: hypothetical protein [unclassified Pseudomonas]MBC8647930.1 hypothetical protein [Pseudomonas sp. MT4]QXY93838.1 hypothetical protein GYM54_20615 [Pseudomonas sp. MTM4]